MAIVRKVGENTFTIYFHFRLPNAHASKVQDCPNCAINGSCYDEQVNPWWPNKCGPLNTFDLSKGPIGGDFVTECLLGKPLVVMGDFRMQLYFTWFHRQYLGKCNF